MSFGQTIRTALKGAVKVVVVGIGNELNGDDGFGVHVAGKLGTSRKTVCILAHTVPENFISKIASEKPSHVIFIDAAVLDSPPGTLQLIDSGDLAKIKTITHRMPLSKLIERLGSLHKCKVFIIGFQPAGMEIGAGLSPEARRAAQELVKILKENLS